MMLLELFSVSIPHFYPPNCLPNCHQAARAGRHSPYRAAHIRTDAYFQLLLSAVPVIMGKFPPAAGFSSWGQGAYTPPLGVIA